MAHIKDKFGFKINNSMLRVSVLVYLFIFLFIVGNLVCFHQDNLILLMELKVSNKIQLICYETMELRAIRTMANKSRTFRQFNLDTIKTIQQLKIQKTRIQTEEEVLLGQLLWDTLDFRYINF